MKSKRIAVFPGSFDPITIGHVDIIKRTIPLFDEIIIAIGVHTQKKYMFSLEQRKEWISKIFSDYSSVSVEDYTGLTVEFCKKMKANFIIRGLRNSVDFEYEKTIAQANNSLHSSLETILILTKPELSFVSSSIVREIIKNGGDADQFLPVEVVV